MGCSQHSQEGGAWLNGGRCGEDGGFGFKRERLQCLQEEMQAW